MAESLRQNVGLLRFLISVVEATRIEITGLSLLQAIIAALKTVSERNPNEFPVVNIIVNSIDPPLVLTQVVFGIANDLQNLECYLLDHSETIFSRFNRSGVLDEENVADVMVLSVDPETVEDLRNCYSSIYNLGLLQLNGTDNLHVPKNSYIVLSQLVTYLFAQCGRVMSPNLIASRLRYANEAKLATAEILPKQNLPPPVGTYDNTIRPETSLSSDFNPQSTMTDLNNRLEMPDNGYSIGKSQSMLTLDSTKADFDTIPQSTTDTPWLKYQPLHLSADGSNCDIKDPVPLNKPMPGLSAFGLNLDTQSIQLGSGQHSTSIQNFSTGTDCDVNQFNTLCIPTVESSISTLEFQRVPSEGSYTSREMESTGNMLSPLNSERRYETNNNTGNSIEHISLLNPRYCLPDVYISAGENQQNQRLMGLKDTTTEIHTDSHPDIAPSAASFRVTDSTFNPLSGGPCYEDSVSYSTAASTLLAGTNTEIYGSMPTYSADHFSTMQHSKSQITDVQRGVSLPSINQQTYLTDDMLSVDSMSMEYSQETTAWRDPFNGPGVTSEELMVGSPGITSQQHPYIPQMDRKSRLRRFSLGRDDTRRPTGSMYATKTMSPTLAPSGIDNCGGGGSSSSSGERVGDVTSAPIIDETRQRILLKWFLMHLYYPYPKASEKRMLSEMTGLHIQQIKNWFINARRRY